MTTSRKRASAVFIVLAIGLLLLAANGGSLLVVDDAQHSDLIVVLAGETNYRPARGLKLLAEGNAPRLLLNVPANSQIFGSDETELARKYVHALPQSAAIEICPIEGLSTKAETVDIKKCLQHEPGSKILIVTSDFHTRRALSILQHEIPSKSFSVAAVHDPTQFGVRWWMHRQWAKTCLDEWLRFVWWSVVERWS